MEFTVRRAAMNFPNKILEFPRTKSGPCFVPDTLVGRLMILSEDFESLVNRWSKTSQVNTVSKHSRLVNEYKYLPKLINLVK